MRPVRKGASPNGGDYSPYDSAKPDLISRLGTYCSYCERRIPTLLAVEHIQPKSLYPALETKWDNFLLGCTNCNSVKLNKNVDLRRVFLPDRDNTFQAFTYSPDGTVTVNPVLTRAKKIIGAATLALTGLDRVPNPTFDANGNAVAVERISQRRQAWLLAEESRGDLASSDTVTVRGLIANLAVQTGFFSVWMTVFAADSDMRNRFIDAFSGTRASGCFTVTATLVIPGPNPDGLPKGRKA